MSVQSAADLVIEILNNIRPESEFGTSRDFVSDGLLDSFDIISLVAALDEQFSINIDGREIRPENFRSVEAICRLVERAGSDQRG